MIVYISGKLSNDLKVGLTNANFYSVLRDGSTDAFITEKKLFLQPSPIGEDRVKIYISYLDLETRTQEELLRQ